MASPIQSSSTSPEDFTATAEEVSTPYAVEEQEIAGPLPTAKKMSKFKASRLKQK